MFTKLYNNIQLTIVKDFEEISDYASDYTIKKISANPSTCLLLPTGTSPVGLYQRLSQQDPSLFAGVTFFNLDEYCFVDNNEVTMIPETDERSYHYYMQQHLFSAIHAKKTYFPDEKNAQKEGTYDEMIKNMGGIDLCINAIGEDGHSFGFNFPGASFSARTRLVQMNTDTKAVNTKLTGQDIPDYAMTTGIATGMDSKEILLLVTGERKAKKLKEVIYGPITEAVPASIMKNHPNCHWVVDEAAASLF